jgi:acetyl-CoA carboxylase carboxyl transferase alpha subunit/acetyl-CoA carboxylase carboxyl transferase beta subunit
MTALSNPVEALRPPGASAPAWLICPRCHRTVYRKRFERLQHVCPECGHHATIGAERRIGQLLDAGSVDPVPVAETVHDPLSFVDQQPYPRRLARARLGTGHADAVRVVRGRIEGRPAVLAVMDFAFMGGSLGVAAGAAITAAAAAASAARVPLVVVTASGGARMQEGAFALMQMANTANAMAELDEAGLLTVTVVMDPTYGGVAASFASLSDVIVAEPRARLGFAGPRVIAQTIGEDLPEGFQSAERLFDNGLVDGVRPRGSLRPFLGRLLDVNAPVPPGWNEHETDPVVRDPGRVPALPALDAIQRARHIDRPTALDHVAGWLDGFVELHGDRLAGDCPAVVGGIGMLDGMPVMLIGQQKGHTTAELVGRNFGMPEPAGYRKARRLMLMAAKLGLPIVTLIDTPGAHPGVRAEQQGQSVAIAECLRTLGALPVPVVGVVIGEGGSGGALALAAADRLLVCESSTLSVISAEGCAAILWNEPGAIGPAAGALGLDARSLLVQGIVDGIVPEPPGGAHLDAGAAVQLVRRAVVCALRDLRGEPAAALVERRRRRFRSLGLAPAPSGAAMAETVR